MKSTRIFSVRVSARIVPDRKNRTVQLKTLVRARSSRTYQERVSGPLVT
jgi:hypothetical protein